MPGHLTDPTRSLRARRAAEAAATEQAAAVDELVAAQSDTPAPAAADPVASNQVWRDETANRATSAWYQLDATKAVMVNWTFFNNASSGPVDLNIRVADTPADYANAVYIAERTLVSPGNETTVSAIIPPGKSVQIINAAGLAIRHMLELTL